MPKNPNSKASKKSKKRKYDKPISLYPLKPEEALSLFMQVDPKKSNKKSN
jgi:hypothetical protein